MDKHLKFSSQEEAESILFDKVEDVLVPKFGLSVDVIGKIYKQTSLVPGWHVNVRGVGVDDFVEYEVTVATPCRVWA